MSSSYTYDGVMSVPPPNHHDRGAPSTPWRERSSEQEGGGGGGGICRGPNSDHPSTPAPDT